MIDQDWSLLAALAKLGSISAVARARGLSISTVSRRLEALERGQGLSLIVRKGGRAVLTPQGKELAAAAGPLTENLTRIERIAANLRASHAHTPIYVSATEFVVTAILAPRLDRLWAKHPDIAVGLRVEAELVSLAAGEADLAIRMTRPEAPGLIMRKLPEVRQGLFASSGYLEGRAAGALNFAEERILGYDLSYGRIPELAWLQRIAASPALSTGSTSALLAACIAGTGIALLPARFALDAGLLEIPIPTKPAARQPWLIVHEDSRRNPAVRAIGNWIAEAFRQAFA